MDHQTVTRQSDRKLARPQPVPQTPSLPESYEAVRRCTETLCEPLETEDYIIQSMPDASPTRWHLAHTSWFFETLVLSKAVRGYKPYHPDFIHLFNSYYNSIGTQFPKPRRGMLSRPTVREIFDYRGYVDQHMRELLADLDEEAESDVMALTQVGLHHEQQHQELILTDIKHVFACNPLFPVYHKRTINGGKKVLPLRWIGFEEGLRSIGNNGEGFSYDNERPRHRVLVPAFELASRLVTNEEFLAFIDDGGYQRPEFWLSEGWATVQERDWRAPLYWEKRGDGWWQFTLSGLRHVEPAQPVCHVSYYEADAYARWSGASLPSEAAWEVAVGDSSVAGNFLENGHHHPQPATGDDAAPAPFQLFGDVWEWTCSPYTAYPGYRPPDGALGEYNGKFMCNQFVLRGGSCATPSSHMRSTYRNFFPPDARWQFSGFRLARWLSVP